MIPVISVVNWLRKNFKVVAVGLVSLLIATIFYQHN
jgi:septal ring factor EnvC (AmiA/AmiB activator)|nr:MAG TPA: SCIMP protein [Caudoviricetes sp.]